MAGPWEKYQSKGAGETSGPWKKYSQPKETDKPFLQGILGDRAYGILNKPQELSQQGLTQIAAAIPNPEPTGNMGLDLIRGTPRIAAETMAEAVPSFISPEAMVTSGIAKGIQASGTLANTAKEAGRRALGFTKQHLSSTKSPFEAMRKVAQAEKASEAMLDANVIPPTGSPNTMQTRALDVLGKARAQMNEVIDSAKGAAIDGQKVATRLIDEISPKFADQEKLVEGLLDDLSVVSKNGPLDLNTAMELKARWGSLGFDVKTVGTEGAKVYRKAERFLDRVIAESLEASGGKELLSKWNAAKTSFANSSTALKGITNQVAAEMGNNAAGLPAMIMASGQLAGGNPIQAAATLGITEVLKRRGAAMTATAAKSLQNTPAQVGSGFSAIIARARQKDKKK